MTRVTGIRTFSTDPMCLLLEHAGQPVSALGFLREFGFVTTGVPVRVSVELLQLRILQARLLSGPFIVRSASLSARSCSVWVSQARQVGDTCSPGCTMCELLEIPQGFRAIPCQKSLSPLVGWQGA